MFAAIKNWLANLHKLPDSQMAEFRSEGLILIHEWIKTKLTYLNFKAPGKRFGYKSVWFKSFLVVTKTRIWATAFGKLAINVPFTDERIRSMKFSVEDGERLVVSFDASLFQPTWSGILEYRFTIPDAQNCLDVINLEIAAHG